MGYKQSLYTIRNCGNVALETYGEDELEGKEDQRKSSFGNKRSLMEMIKRRRRKMIGKPLRRSEKLRNIVLDDRINFSYCFENN